MVLFGSEAQVFLLLNRVVCSKKRAKQDNYITPSDISAMYPVIHPDLIFAINARITYVRHLSFFSTSTFYSNTSDDLSQIEKKKGKVRSPFNKYYELLI